MPVPLFSKDVFVSHLNMRCKHEILTYFLTFRIPYKLCHFIKELNFVELK
jgi:hypothetical protein